MTNGPTTLDMAMMYAVHDALRRDAAQIARISRGTGDDPRLLLRSAVGWELFKSFLHIHHTVGGRRHLAGDAREAGEPP